ncbi:hypothetical protein [Burkholderia pseudomallei]|uniref:hypothetical protein n=1 Tax=Burkholderia pseudomallei TaxID=28450 RepID=UPI0009B1F6A0|nr:hypothetical protein [Burkholderia pseudomallei]AYE32739.1 hypothetical protein CNX72_28190 [Burkholderia pseudomallei]
MRGACALAASGVSAAYAVPAFAPRFLSAWHGLQRREDAFQSLHIASRRFIPRCIAIAGACGRSFPAVRRDRPPPCATPGRALAGSRGIAVES